MGQGQIIQDAGDWEQMDGETPTLKRLNSQLTLSFIGRRDLPSDECLSEARHLVSLWGLPGWAEAARYYLVRQFATAYPMGDQTKTPEVLPGGVRRAEEVLPLIEEILRA